MNANTYLKRFFEEKEVPYTSWTIVDGDEEHHIDTEVVVEAIMNTPQDEKKKIVEMLRLIDYNNGCVVNYLRFLAGAMIRQRRDCNGKTSTVSN